MQIDKKTIALAIITALAILVFGYLFNITGLSLGQLLDLAEWKTTLGRLVSIEFICAVLILPLAYSAAIIAMKKNPSYETIGICTLAAAIAVLVPMTALPNIMYYWPIALTLIASIPIAMYFSSVYFQELKKYVVLRAVHGGTKKGALILMLGILLFGAIVLAPKNKELATQFEYNMIEFIAGPKLSNVTNMAVSDEVYENAADNLIQQQMSTINQLSETQAYQNLKQKTDSDVIAFIGGIETIKQQMQSPEHKQEIINQLKQSSENTIQQSGLDETTLLQTIKKSFPIMQQIENLFWLLTALIIIGIVQLIMEFIIAPLSGLYAIALDKAFKDSEEKQPQPKF